MHIFGCLHPGKNKKKKHRELQRHPHELEDILLNERAELEAKIEMELSRAKKYRSLNRRYALQALQRKKIYKIELNKIDRAIENIQKQKIASEGINFNVEISNELASSSMIIEKANNRINKLLVEISSPHEDINKAFQSARSDEEELEADFRAFILNEQPAYPA